MLRERTFDADERDKVVLDVFDAMCSTRTTAGRWCKSKNNAGADLCRKCYRKELKDAATKERIQRVDDELEKIRLAISG